MNAELGVELDRILVGTQVDERPDIDADEQDFP
jgi:hypothetical protein